MPDLVTIYGIRNCDTMKKAFAPMLENPSMIRRPVVASGKTLLIGCATDLDDLFPSAAQAQRIVH